jgi:2-keto-4-pentenoate hydratase/2-oxohepta-3-ene-1,7-dioic acid hydratase in catechol pathway
VSRASRPFALGLFSAPGQPALPTPFVGVVLDTCNVLPLAQLFPSHAPWPGAALPDSIFALLQDWDGAFAAISGALDRDDAGRLATMPLDGLRAHAPLAQTRQLICTGANYRQHVIDLVVAQGGGAGTEGMTAEERRADAAARVDSRAAGGIPYAFPKLVGAITGPCDDIVVPRDAQQLDWELELGVVIGRACWRVPRESAMAAVAGYLIVNDITRRELVYRPDLRSLGSDWLRAKSGPGFMPIGPLFVPAAFVADPHQLRLRLELNGQVMQDESTADMIFRIERQIEYVSSYARLLPGDILATGSPAGNGMHHGRFLQPGDRMRATITGLGEQVNHLIAEES